MPQEASSSPLPTLVGFFLNWLCAGLRDGDIASMMRFFYSDMEVRHGTCFLRIVDDSSFRRR